MQFLVLSLVVPCGSMIGLCLKSFIDFNKLLSIMPLGCPASSMQSTCQHGQEGVSMDWKVSAWTGRSQHDLPSTLPPVSSHTSREAHSLSPPRPRALRVCEHSQAVRQVDIETMVYRPSEMRFNTSGNTSCAADPASPLAFSGGVGFNS